MPAALTRHYKVFTSMLKSGDGPPCPISLGVGQAVPPTLSSLGAEPNVTLQSDSRMAERENARSRRSSFRVLPSNLVRPHACSLTRFQLRRKIPPNLLGRAFF